MAPQDSSPKATPAELAADIARQREQVAATVNELQEHVAVTAKNTARQAAVVAGVVAGVAAAVLVVAIVVKTVKRRRS